MLAGSGLKRGTVASFTAHATSSRDNGVIWGPEPVTFGRSLGTKYVDHDQFNTFEKGDIEIVPGIRYVGKYSKVSLELNSISMPFTFFMPSTEPGYMHGGPLAFRNDVPTTFFSGHITGILHVRRAGSEWPLPMIFLVVTHAETREEYVGLLTDFPSEGIWPVWSAKRNARRATEIAKQLQQEDDPTAVPRTLPFTQIIQRIELLEEDSRA